jgi:hypothetical protein
LSWWGGKQDAATREGHPVPPSRALEVDLRSLGVALGCALVLLLVVASVALGAVPANDDFADREVLSGSLPIEVMRSNVEATKEEGESISFFAAGHSMWFEWEATATEWVTIGACGSDFPAVVAIFTGGEIASLSRAVSGNSAEGPHCPYSEREYTFKAHAGTDYVVGVDGNSFGFPEAQAPIVEGTVELRIESTPLPPNDDFANAANLTATGEIYEFEPENRFYFARLQGYNWTATKEPEEPDHEGDPGGASVWYEWTAPATGTLRMSACCFAFPAVGVYTGDSLGALAEVSTRSEFPPEVTASVIAGQTYRIAVDGRLDEGTGEPARVFFAISAFMTLPPLWLGPVSQPGGAASDPPDVTAPNTRINRRVPRRHPLIWAFDLRSSEPGVTFRCKIDKKRFTFCSSPLTSRGLRPGPHTLEVVAVDQAGNVDPSPAIARFKVHRHR